MPPVRAVDIGLPALTFTEHVDLTPWALDGRDLPDHNRGHLGADGSLRLIRLLSAEFRPGLCAGPGVELLSDQGLSVPEQRAVRAPLVRDSLAPTQRRTPRND